MFDDILLEYEEKLENAVTHLASEFKGVRTGRATPGLVENIRADYYGSPTPLKNMANISVPTPRQIVIKPYEASQLTEIEKAIQKSELGINPSNDGKVIRLEVPALTEERRKQIVKQVKEMADTAKVSINNARRDANKAGETAEKDGHISEDDLTRLKKKIDELKTDYAKQIDDLFDKKSEEVLKV